MSSTKNTRHLPIGWRQQTWAKHREVELENPAALVHARDGNPTLAELIRWYSDNFETVSKWQRSKQTHLEFLERHRIAECDALQLSTQVLIDHIRSRRADGCGPSTAADAGRIKGV